ncbi:MAG: winged helix-turn-helix domain-containing protein [Butyrivibrio sp.]|nr:winged helix-turn-helix domain-containing protein [Butyrivibrio sp.]
MEKSRKRNDNENEKQLLELLNQEPTITIARTAEVLGWKETLVKYYIASLKKKGMLLRNGTSHNGIWVVNKD